LRSIAALKGLSSNSTCRSGKGSTAAFEGVKGAGLAGATASQRAVNIVTTPDEILLTTELLNARISSVPPPRCPYLSGRRRNILSTAARARTRREGLWRGGVRRIRGLWYAQKVA
jgi:hypothetical protein